MFDKPLNLLIALGVLGSFTLIGLIIFPTGAATLCSRYGITVAGTSQSCYTCSRNASACQFCQIGTKCVCMDWVGTAAVNTNCQSKFNSGSMAMLVIGVMLVIFAGGFLGYVIFTKLEAIKQLPDFAKGGFKDTGEEATVTS